MNVKNNKTRDNDKKINDENDNKNNTKSNDNKTSINNDKTKNMNKKIRRGRGKGKIKSQKLLIYSNNAAGISSKVKSFTNNINTLNASVFMLQETHLTKKGKFSKMKNLKGYEVFELIRTEKDKGGLAIGIKEELRPVLISEGDDEIEILVVEGHINNQKIRFINCYGPQENDNHRSNLFYARLSKEIAASEVAGCSTFVEMDANSKLGREYIKNDPSEKPTPNGKILIELLSQNDNIFLLNGSKFCEGTITRSRKVGDKVEKSVIDFALMSTDLLPHISRMIIDEERNFSLTHITKEQGQAKYIDSDHNPLITEFNISFKKANNTERKEVFNYKNKECQKEYKRLTNKTTKFTDIVNDDNNDINEIGDKFLKTMINFSHRSFKKIRVKKESKISKIDELMNIYIIYI